MKILLSLGVFILCVGIIGIGGYSTVSSIEFEAMAEDFEEAMSGPLFSGEDPDDEGGKEDGDENLGGEDGKEDGNENLGGDDGKEDDDENLGGENVENSSLSSNEAKDSFRDLYENHDPDFTEVKKEMISNLLMGMLGGTKEEPEEPEEPEVPEEEPDFDENLDMDFSTDFNPDDFEPEEEPEEEEPASDVDQMVSDVLTTYIDNLFKDVESKSESMDSTAAAENAVKEAEAVVGLANVVKSSDEVEDKVIVDSVDAILNSNVCMNTVTDAVENTENFTEEVQKATESMNEETKAEIQGKIETSLEDFRASADYDAEKEKQYADLANLFGITLNNVTLPN